MKPMYIWSVVMTALATAGLATFRLWPWSAVSLHGGLLLLNLPLILLSVSACLMSRSERGRYVPLTAGLIAVTSILFAGFMLVLVQEVVSGYPAGWFWSAFFLLLSSVVWLLRTYFGQLALEWQYKRQMKLLMKGQQYTSIGLLAIIGLINF